MGCMDHPQVLGLLFGLPHHILVIRFINRFLTGCTTLYPYEYPIETPLTRGRRGHDYRNP